MTRAEIAKDPSITMNEGDVSTISWANQGGKAGDAQIAQNSILKGLNDKQPGNGAHGQNHPEPKNHHPPATPVSSQHQKEALVPPIKVDNIHLDANPQDNANSFNKLFDEGPLQGKAPNAGSRGMLKGNVTMSFEKKAAGNVKITPRGAAGMNTLQENPQPVLGQNILEPEPTGPSKPDLIAAPAPKKAPEPSPYLTKSPAPAPTKPQPEPATGETAKDNPAFHRNSPSQTVESSKTMVIPQRAEKPFPQTTSFAQPDASLDELQKLRSTNLELKSELSTLKHSFEDYQIQKEKDIQRLKKDIEEKDGSLKRLMEERKEAAKLKKDFELKQLEMAELKESLNSLQNTQPEIVRLNKLNAAHLATIEHEREASDKLRAKCANLEQEAKDKNEEAKSLRDKIQEQAKTLTAKENDFSKELERQETASREKIRSLEQAIVASV